MKKHYKCLGFLVFCLAISFILPVIPLTSGNIDISYTFNNEVLIDEEDTIDYTDVYNLDHPLTYTDIYNATDSFTNTSHNQEPLNWTIDESGGSILVLDSLDGHDKIMEINDTNAGDSVIAYKDFTKNSNGTYEFWIRTNDATDPSYFTIRDSDGIGVCMYIGSDLLYYDAGSGGVSTGKTILDDTWYHIRIDFECSEGNYEGLSADTYYCYLDGLKLGPYDFYSQKSYVNRTCFYTTDAGVNYKTYVDAIGLYHEADYDYYAYDGYFNFENETLGAYNEWTDNLNAEIVNTGNNHSNYLRLYENGGTMAYTNFNSAQSYGTIEMWVKASDAGSVNQFRFNDISSTMGILWQIDADKLYVYNSGWTDTGFAVSDDVWYHVQVDFECTSGNYKGLSQWKWQIIINGNTYSSYSFYTNVQIQQYYVYMSAGDPDRYLYLDSIDFSWKNGYYNNRNKDLTEYGSYHSQSIYQIGDNIIPFSYDDDDYYVIDSFLFEYDHEFLPYEDGDMITHSWSCESEARYYDIDGTNTVKVFGKNGGTEFFSNSFTSTSDFIYISFNLTINELEDNPDSYLSLVIANSDSSACIWLNYNTINEEYLKLWDNIESEYIENHITEGCEYLVQIMINRDTEKYSIMHTNSTHSFYKIRDISATGKNGLSSITFSLYDIDDPDYHILLSNIKVREEGGSLSDDWGGIFYDLDVNWNSHHHNLLSIETQGNLSCSVYISNEDNKSSIHLLLEDYNFNISNEIFMNLYNDHYFNIYNASLFLNVNEQFKIANNFYFNYIYIRGNSITDDVNTYFLSYANSGIDNNDSYFYVDSNHRLQYYLYTDDNNTEYIQAIFNIDNKDTTNRFITFRASVIGESSGTLQVAFTDTSNIFDLEQLDKGYSEEITQSKTLDYFVFQITDDDEEYEGYTTGSLSNLVLRYSTNFAITILTLNLVNFLLPLIIIIAPSIAISEYTGKNLFVPLFFLFTLILTVSLIVPYWIMFIVALAFFLFILTEKDYFERMIK